MEYKIRLKDVDKQCVMIMINGIPFSESIARISKALARTESDSKGWWLAEMEIPDGMTVDVWEKKFPHGDVESELVESFISGNKREPKTTEQLEKLTWSIESK